MRRDASSTGLRTILRHHRIVDAAATKAEQIRAIDAVCACCTMRYYSYQQDVVKLSALDDYIAVHC